MMDAALLAATFAATAAVAFGSVVLGWRGYGRWSRWREWERRLRANGFARCLHCGRWQEGTPHYRAAARCRCPR